MKLLSFILSFYILLLTAIPCNDVHQDKVFNKVEISQASQDHYMDHCSPFCTCECCASPVLFEHSSIQIVCLAVIQSLYTEKPSGHFCNLHTSIWQPPKMA